MTTSIVPEAAPRKLRVSFYDEQGVAAVPASVTYRIDCLTTATVVRGDTTVDPAAEVTIDIAGSDTAIVNATNSREKKRVTVIAGFVDGNEPSEFDFIVKNMSGV